MSKSRVRPGLSTSSPLGKVILGAAIVWLVLVVVSAVLAPWIAPYDPYTQDLNSILSGPTWHHLLGTDTLGRDVLSRLMFGALPTISSVLLAIVVYLAFGTVGGLVAGYFGSWRDRTVISISNVVMAFPGIIVLFVVLSVFRGNVYLGMAIFGLLSSPTIVVLVRSSAVAVRHELFIDAAKASGLSSFYIISRHVFPRVRGLLLSQVAIFAAHAIVTESTLSFLGLGIQPPTPSWGNMVAEAATRISLNPFMLYATGGTIALTALSVGLFSEFLRTNVTRGWGGSKFTRSGARSRTRAAAASDGFLARPEGPILTVDHLSVEARVAEGTTTIVRDVSLVVATKETLGLVGESGSGKTTVAYGILGLLGDDLVATAGNVRLDATDLTSASKAELGKVRGRRIGYVAQEPMVALDPNFRVGSQLKEAVRRNTALRGDALRRRVVSLLEMVELREPHTVVNKFPHELSGGMAQRVSIAFALSGDPELLIADEPTTALDVTVQAGILGLLRRLREQTGMSMLIITHDWGVVADVCDRVAVMHDGSIVEQAALDDIFERPSHPYTRALLAANPHGAPRGQDLPTVADLIGSEADVSEVDLPQETEGLESEIAVPATEVGAS